MLGKILIILLAAVSIFSIYSCSSEEDKLFNAVKNGDLEEVRSLIEGGMSVLSTNSRGLTALEIARLNNQIEIAEYLYDETKKIFDKETELLLKIKYNDELAKLLKLEKDRLEYFRKFTDCNEKITGYLSRDIRLSDDLMYEQEKYFKVHQKLFRDLINAKVDLVEDILGDFIDKDFVSTIESRDARQIVNSNILGKFSKAE